MSGSRLISAGAKALQAQGVALYQHLEAHALRSPVTFAFATVGLLFAAFFTLLEPSFQTNDDIQLAMIASGTGIGLQPDEHLVFTSVVIGHVLKALYTEWPSVAWYSLYLYAAQYLAQTAILYCAIAAGYTRLRLVLYLLFFATVGVFLLNNLQFTTTASLAGQSGALLLLLLLVRRADAAPPQLLRRSAAGIGLLVLASLMRLECFYLTGIVSLSAAVCLVGWPLRRQVLVPAIAVVVCLAVVLTLAAFNDAYYARDPEWQNFFSYNKLRVKFNDYECITYMPHTAHVFDAVDWSENDYEMIAHWFYEDPVVYSEARLRMAVNGHAWHSERLTASYWWSGAREILRDRSLWPAMLVFPLFVLCSLSSRPHRLALFSCMAAAAVLLVSMAALHKLPPNRVYFSVLTFPLVLLMMMVREDVKLLALRWPAKLPARGSLAATALILLAVLGLGLGLARQYRSSRKMQLARSELHQLFAKLEPRDDRLYVVWAPGFPYQAISPFDNLRSFSNRHQLVLGWPQRTPVSEAMLKKFHIADLPVALYSRGDVVMVGRRNIHPFYSKYVEEHHGVNVRFVADHLGPSDYHLAGHFEAVEPPDSPRNAERRAHTPTR